MGDSRDALLRVIRGEEGPDVDAALRAMGQGVEGELGDVLRAIVALPKSDRRREAAKALRLIRESKPPPPAPGPKKRPKKAESPRPPDPMDWPVQSLPGIGPKGAESLRSHHVHTLGDLVEVLPRRYEDRRKVVTVADLVDGTWAVVGATVVRRRVTGPPWQRRIELVIESGGSEIPVVFFHARPGMADRYEPGAPLRLAGTPRPHGGGLQLAHPEVVAVGAEAAAPGRVTPRYPLVYGIAPKTFAKAIEAALVHPIPDILPAGLAEKLGLPSRAEALRQIHNPSEEIDAEALVALEVGRSPAHRTLAAEELFLHELVSAKHRGEEARASAPALPDAPAVLGRVAAVVPFALTAAQRRTVSEIAEDLRAERPMRRLLQGDVGSGKTVVALAAVLAALDAGKQAAVMAPTEILAVQHAKTLQPWLDALGHRLTLLLGSQGSAARKKSRRSLELGSAGLAIGTHALLTESVEIPRLAVCVVDEQHRFGVAQRLRLVDKGLSPHLLVMTATPIPRTLALAMHGDLSLSVLDERPAGRLPPRTSLHGPRDRKAVWKTIGEALDAGARGFVLCPLVEESAFTDQSAAVPLHEELAKKFERHRVALVHGRLKPEDKFRAMEEFADGRARLLVATTVVEVGIDVPDATFVVIDGAERFGLSQLHQIRGRVGRGGGESRCLLLHGDVPPMVVDRLREFSRTDDGFEVAELDLRIRGPGDLSGLRQSGLTGLSFADPLRDLDLLLPAREVAKAIAAEDPELVRHVEIAKAIARRWPVTGRPIREEGG